MLQADSFNGLTHAGHYSELMEINCFGIILACAKESSQFLKENAIAAPCPHLQSLV